MPRLLHIADVHLGASCSAFGDAAEQRRQAVSDAFVALPEVIAAESVDAVVIAGDLFDTPRPSADLLAMTRETVRRMDEAGAPVFAVPGNHDTVTLRPNPYADPLGPGHVLTSPSFGPPISVETRGGPLHVYGVAYDPAQQPDPLGTFRRFDAPGAHVVLLHGSVPGAPHWERSPNALRLPLEDLASLPVDYIALGDHHRFRPPDRFGDGLPACYSGSFAALDLTETGPRGFVIVDVQPGRAPAPRHHASAVPSVEPLDDFDVGGCESEVEVANRVASDVPEGVVPLVTLTGSATFPLNVDVVETELRARFPFARALDRSSYYGAGHLEELATGDTIVGHVVRIGRRRIDEATGDEQRHDAERALRTALRALEVE